LKKRACCSGILYGVRRRGEAPLAFRKAALHDRLERPFGPAWSSCRAPHATQSRVRPYGIFTDTSLVLVAKRLEKRAVCRSPIQMRQPTIPTPASTRKAPLSPPVPRLTRPMRSGPKNAPLGSTALMSAIDAAAAGPLNSIAGRHQKAGWNTAPPIGINASAATRSPEVGAIANPTQPRDMSARPTAAYPHRSVLRIGYIARSRKLEKMRPTGPKLRAR
jgi:hypothetical protein